MGFRILVTEPIPASNIHFLQTVGEVTVGEQGQFLTEESLLEVIGHYDALLCMLSTPVTSRVMEAAHQLKIVANFDIT